MKQVNSNYLDKVTWIPLSLATFAEQHDLIEELRLYISLKLSCSGNIKGKKKLFKPKHSIRSHHTLKKRLERLKKLNWVGHDSNNDIFFIRSNERVCTDMNLSAKTHVEFELKYFEYFRVFVFAAIVGKKIKSMEYAKKKRKEECKLVPKYWERTKPSLPLPAPDYIGLSVASMAKLTGKSMSWRSELKNLAEGKGLLMTG